MKPLNSYILPLLFLLACVPHIAFALDDDQEPISYEAHLLSVEEYRTCLKGVATIEDFYGLYDMKTMSGELIQTEPPENQQIHFLYSVLEDVDPQSPMLGLTELDAMRCCNWMETSLPSNDNTPPSTEVGSYVLHEDGSFEVNQTAQLHLIHHDDGTFEIISSVKKTASPLMMFGGERGDDNKGKSVRPFPDVGRQTAANRRQYDSLDGQDESSSQQNSSAPAMNITVPSLANILHNDNFDDASLIGHTGGAPGSSGSYVAIQDHLWCLPAMIKACFTTKETRQQTIQARQSIRNALEVAMKESSTYKEKVAAGFTFTLLTSGRTDLSKIAEDLNKFDQYFINHNLTRGNLEQFCNTHGITVPEPKTGRITKISGGGAPSMYGSVDLGELGNRALKGIQVRAKNIIHQLTEGDLELTDHGDQVPNERTRLTTATPAPRQITVFNKDHVQEVYTLIEQTKKQSSPGTRLQAAYDLFDMKAANPHTLTPTAKKLLAQIRGTADSNKKEYYNNWVYESLDPSKKIITLENAIASVEANLKKTEAIANQALDLAGGARNFAQMSKQLADK